MLDDHNIFSLVSLLDDPDEAITDHIKSKLIDLGPSIVEKLESYFFENDFTKKHKDNIEDVIHTIHIRSIHSEIKEWINSGDKNLLNIWFILSKWNYPNLQEEKVNSTISSIKKEIWLEINENQTAFEKVKILNNVLFNKFKFKGDNTTNYHSPLNSYLNTVLETKKGNPLSLSILYACIANDLNLPIYGVNFPSHFVLAYLDEHKINPLLGKSSHQGVLFYINVFSGGVILNKEDLSDFLQKIKTSVKQEYFEPCSNTTIAKRIIFNLIASYKNSNEKKVSELNQLLTLFERS
jgi:regulator of sirC expression with transglutaminase-like and TPR domain